jgi:hypothetical protein
MMSLAPSGDAARADRDIARGPGDVLDAAPLLRRDGGGTMERLCARRRQNAKQAICASFDVFSDSES